MNYQEATRLKYFYLLENCTVQAAIIYWCILTDEGETWSSFMNDQLDIPSKLI